MRRFTRILFSLPHNGGAHSAPARERRGAKGPRERPSRGVGRSPTLVSKARYRARAPWREDQSQAGATEQVIGSSERGWPHVRRESGFAHLPEQHARYAVLLHLDMQGLVVGSKEPRRLALVPLGVLKNPADRLLFGVRRGCLGDFFERRTDCH